jgi:membrane protein DedA with SNARE-associated domain
MWPILDHLLRHYGYAAVFLFMVAEGCGIPLPAETMLVSAAAFTSRGTLSLWGVGIAGALGGVVGGTAGYGIGAKGGLPFLRRYGSKVGLGEERLDRARDFFRRRGLWAAFLSRFIAFLRLAIPMLAGVTHMPFARFSAANAVGAVLSALLYCVLGYEFGRDLPALEHHLVLTSGVALMVLLLVLGVSRTRRGR